ncbi:DUF7426 family protein [Williamsia soli]|uniref:DUF7426 family protein n=1 Tax=Williamsia soli TaxID=364929 RepID=UPI001A9DB58B|nr:hypothetical protein [Williamsia soli]
MATRYDPLEDHYDPDLYLPIGDVVYQIPAPSITEADRIRPFLWGPEADGYKPDAEQADAEKMLGPAYLEMTKNEVPAPYVNHAGRTALIHFCSGPQGPELGRGHWVFAHLSERIDVQKLMKYMAAERDKKRNQDAAREAMKSKADV